MPPFRSWRDWATRSIVPSRTWWRTPPSRPRPRWPSSWWSRWPGASWPWRSCTAGSLREALEPLRAGREALGRAERGVSLARMRLAAAGERIEEHARALARLGRSGLRQAERSQRELRFRLAELAPRLVESGARERLRLGERIAGSARGRLREARATMQGMERLCVQLSPERTLERGFSVTRGPGGALLRDPSQVAAGRPRHHPIGRRKPHEPSGGAMNDLFSEPETPAESGEALSFREAMEELEGILERIEGEEIDIDRLAEELRRAAQLLDLCRGKIRKAEVEVTQIVQSLEEGPGEEG